MGPLYVVLLQRLDRPCPTVLNAPNLSISRRGRRRWGATGTALVYAVTSAIRRWYLASIRSTMINLTATIPAIRLSSDAVEPRVMSTNRKREIFVTCPLVSASPALEMQSAAVAARFYMEIMLEKCVSFSMKAPAALTVNKSLSREKK